MMTRLSKSLSAWRDLRGVSHRYIADHLGVNESTVSLWFSGKRTPTVNNLEKLAELLGVDIAEVWDGPEAVPATPAMRAFVDAAGHLTDEQLVVLASIARSMTPPKS